MIHLAPLAKWAGIEFLQREVVDMDPTSRTLFLKRDNNNCSGNDDESLEEVNFDVVSFDIGSTSRGLTTAKEEDVDQSWREHVIPTRPISDLVRRIENAEEELVLSRDNIKDQNMNVNVVVIGGGAAGIELALGVRARWNPILCNSDGDSRTNSFSVLLLDAGTELVPNETPKCKEAIKNAVLARDIQVRHNSIVATIDGGDDDDSNNNKGKQIILTDGTCIPFTHCIWATGASAHPLANNAFRKRGIAMNERGWIKVNPTLQSVSHDCVFAAGDCAIIENLPNQQKSPPKAGVYAVRTGPILIENLMAFLRRDVLIDYVPQGDFLKLLMCGDETAIGFRFGLPLQGRWVWQLKDHIDCMFMDLFKVENLPVLKEGSEYDTSQYDAVVENSPLLLAPAEAGVLLTRTDDGVDYEVAWNVLREMRDNEQYRDDVLATIV